MIISHSRRFILVKSRKTASTSIERAIIPQLAKGDMWTPISIPPISGRNYYSLWPVDLLTAKWSVFRDLVGRDSPWHRRLYFDHMPLSRVKGWLEPDTFTSYRKYVFDRNPWDFLVSLYFFQRRKGEVANWEFDRFLHEYPVIQNRELYSEDGKVIADRVFRFEELSEGLNIIAAETGLSFNALPNDKAGYRNSRDYRSFYTPASRDLVASRFAGTIELLNYDF